MRVDSPWMLKKISLMMRVSGKGDVIVIEVLTLR
jgi:hypothetical protein